MAENILNFDRLAAGLSAAALLGLLLLLPLYLSQRRDVRRLRAWMDRAPEHPARDLATSETRLDRAEVELERLYAERGEPVPGGRTEAYPEGMGAAAARVSSERPALERITMERAALEPHPRWRRALIAAGQPRVLAAITVGALVIAAAAIVGSQELLSDDAPTAPGTPAGLDPASIEVAVLNGTTRAGLAGAASSEVEAAGFTLGEVTSISGPREQSVVMYERRRRAAARLVGRSLEIEPLQPITQEAQELAGGAAVAVIVGEDRAED